MLPKSVPVPRRDKNNTNRQSLQKSNSHRKSKIAKRYDNCKQNLKGNGLQASEPARFTKVGFWDSRSVWNWGTNLQAQ